jgi:methylsterol monooxygenase
MEWIGENFLYLFEHYHPGVVVVMGTFFLHEFFYFGVYIPYLIADNIPALRKYKIQMDKENSWPAQWNCFWKIAVVHTFTQIPLMILAYYGLDYVGMSRTPPLPTWQSIVLQIPFFYFVEDFWFYWVHRALHWGPLYKYIHKIHHEHAAPFGIAGEYAHPIESLLLGVGTALGPLLMRAHLLTLWCWLLARVWQVVDAHSGYNFPWSPNRYVPLWGGAEFHDYHHMAFVGNYSSTFTLWDWVFGTDRKYYSWKDQQAQKLQGDAKKIK